MALGNKPVFTKTENWSEVGSLFFFASWKRQRLAWRLASQGDESFRRYPHSHESNITKEMRWKADHQLLTPPPFNEWEFLSVAAYIQSLCFLAVSVSGELAWLRINKAWMPWCNQVMKRFYHEPTYSVICFLHSMSWKMGSAVLETYRSTTSHMVAET